MVNQSQTIKNSCPVLQALLLADRIYTDITGKRIICGTFSRIHSRKFPVAARPCSAFILLVDVIREVELQLRLVSLSDNEILMESSKTTVHCDSPLTPLDLVFEVPPLPLPHEGIYSFECWADGTMIGSVRLQANLLVNQEGNDHEEHNRDGK